MTYPAANFNTITLPVTTFSGNLFRSFSLGRGRTPASVLFFGRAGTERYDSPDNSYGVCYLGLNQAGCFIETFGQSMPRVVDQDVLEERGLATVEANDLTLLDITGAGAFHIGATGVVWAGDRAVSRVWSGAIHLHPDEVDGILYKGNHDPSQSSIALFERASHKVALTTTLDWVAFAGLGDILNTYNIAFL